MSKTIATQLLKYREENKLSQEDLATEIGVHRSTIIRWENEQNLPGQMASNLLMSRGIICG